MGEEQEQAKTPEELLEALLLDSDDLYKLADLAGSKSNLFDVLRIVRTEIRHSNVLAWLLDPSESHGLGNTFIRKFIHRAIAGLEDLDSFEKQDSYAAFFLADFDTFDVRREEDNMDIVLVSAKAGRKNKGIAICIENKIDSGEGTTQLKKYSKNLADRYPEYERLHIFLTPEGREARNDSDKGKWIPVGYDLIQNLLDEFLQTGELSKDNEVIIRHYADIVRRDIVGNGEIIELCNKIYKAHGRAIELVMNNKTDVYSTVRGWFVDWLKVDWQNDNEIKETLGGVHIVGEPAKNAIWFHTPLLERVNERLKKVANTSDEKKVNVTYEIHELNKVKILFNMTGRNEKQRDWLQQLGRAISGKDNGAGNQRWRTVVSWPIKEIYNHNIAEEHEDIDDIKEDVKKDVKRIMVHKLNEKEEKIAEVLSKE